ncbi:phage tail protein [Cytobacillus horneckiae]|uniref:phage tail protein n=1 Tax=Cytobacillus horneckiae TaxID=549687 RepID=UPI0034CDD099
MLLIEDLSKNLEGLTDFNDLNRTRRINGEKTLSLTVFPTDKNRHCFDMIEEESIITFDNEEYVIKKLNEKSIGNTYIKRVEAVHKFFVDMINKQQPKIHNGSMTFFNYMQFVFEDTGYVFTTIDSFTANTFENLGNDNRLALLQKGLERYKAEMEIEGKEVRFKRKIGSDTDFQFRYGHNIKGIDHGGDTTDLATVIRGKGAEGITAYYRSPNADIFGEIDSQPVEDERFTSQATLLEEMKSRLQDAPEKSITIDFVDLRAAGYPYTVPNEGDRVFVIYEPMNNLLLDTRIMEISERFNVDLVPIKTDVTLSSYKKRFAGTMFENIRKQLGKILNDDGKVKYSVLDEAVKIATEAIKSAQTELEFENGIIAREKTNPNELVVLTSKGIGVSTDGGQTFKTAMTARGIVADLLTSGGLDANLVNVFGPVNIIRPDGAVAVNNGVMQGDFVIDRVTPFYMDEEVSLSNNFFMTRSFSSVIADALYFKHAGRYMTFVVWARTLQAGCRVDLVNMDTGETVKINATMGFPYNNQVDSTFQTFVIDLGRPTFRNIGFYVKFNSYAQGVPTYMRYSIKNISG